MKKFTILFCLFLSLNALAQDSGPVHRDTSGVRLVPDMLSVKKHLKFLSVIDDKVYYRRSLKKRAVRHPSSILEVNVLKGKEGTDKYGKLAAHGVIVVTTKPYAIKAYQNKVSGLSKAYKSYLEKNKNNDSDVVYVLNGDVLESRQYETIKKLYEAVEEIKTVYFIEKFSDRLNTNNAKPMVIITTTKQ